MREHRAMSYTEKEVYMEALQEVEFVVDRKRERENERTRERERSENKNLVFGG